MSILIETTLATLDKILDLLTLYSSLKANVAFRLVAYKDPKIRVETEM